MEWLQYSMNPNESTILALEQEKSKAAYTLMWSTTSIYILLYQIYQSFPSCDLVWKVTSIYCVRKSVRSQSHLQKVMESPGHVTDLWRLAAGLGRSPQDARKVQEANQIHRQTQRYTVDTYDGDSKSNHCQHLTQIEKDPDSRRFVGTNNWSTTWQEISASL